MPRISIHAPREGRDVWRRVLGARQQAISIHAPREGRDQLNRAKKELIDIFQSTRPARGATSLLHRACAARLHFNPRAPRGARPRPGYIFGGWTLFQSTRPARGATSTTSSGSLATSAFQSTRPDRTRMGKGGISIHAPREGRDSCPPWSEIGEFISIHAPREGRD